MPRFVIERDIPGAGKLSKEELHAIAQRSCGISQVRSVIDPTTAE